MGSTGIGHLPDYPGSKPNVPGGPDDGNGEDRCVQPVSTMLEDVERCAYYINHKDIPEVGTRIIVIFSGRICAATNGGEIIGYLPTQFNYLAGCINSGRKYIGIVTTSLHKPILHVHVDITAV